MQINSESGKEQAIQQFLKSKFETLGVTVEEDNASINKCLGANNLVCTLKATENMDNVDKVYFTSHMDTVTPGVDIKPQIKDDGYIYSDGTTILGADDKAGLAAILELVQTIKDQELSHGQIQFVITAGKK